MRKALGSVVVAAIAMSAWLHAVGPAPVAEAAMKRDTEAVRALLKNGEDVNAAQGDGMTALHWAARNGDLELTQMLLYAGANVKATTRLGGYTPLLMAADQGHANVIATLVATPLALLIGAAGGGAPGYALAFGAVVAFPFVAAALIPVRGEASGGASISPSGSAISRETGPRAGPVR